MITRRFMGLQGCRFRPFENFLTAAFDSLQNNFHGFLSVFRQFFTFFIFSGYFLTDLNPENRQYIRTVTVVENFQLKYNSILF